MTILHFPQYVSGPVPLRDASVQPDVAVRRAIRRARKGERKLKARIERAVAGGEIERAKGLQARYCRSFHVRLANVASVNPVLKGAERARTYQLPAIARRLDAFRRCDEPVHLVAVNKSSGGFRALTIAGLERASMQKMAREAAKPFHRADPRQFAISGGGHNAAARELCAALEGDAFKWAVCLDIKNFYPTINKEALTNIMPLPRRVVEHVIMPPPVETTCIRHVGRALYGLHLVEASQSGISQGSRCSPLVAEIIIKQVMASFADVQMWNVADDFCILARTKKDAAAISLALTRALARSPAGRFLLCSKVHAGVRRVCDGFDFVGYRFRKRRHYVQCHPVEAKLIQFNDRVLDYAIAIEQGSIKAIKRLRAYVLTWWRSHPLTNAHLSGADFFWARRQVREVVLHHHRSATPIITALMEWNDDHDSFAPVPSAEQLRQLRCAAKMHRYKSRVPHWR